MSRGTKGRRGNGTPVAVAIATAFLGLVAGLALVDKAPVTLLVGYCLLSITAFLTYRADKAAAVQGTWRTPESRLHAVALIGGWPGALVARQLFRHKTKKQPFRAIVWCTVVGNCAVLAWFLHEAPLTLP